MRNSFSVVFGPGVNAAPTLDRRTSKKQNMIRKYGKHTWKLKKIGKKLKNKFSKKRKTRSKRSSEMTGT